jgi:hypothetical protein
MQQELLKKIKKIKWVLSLLVFFLVVPNASAQVSKDQMADRVQEQIQKGVYQGIMPTDKGQDALVQKNISRFANILRNSAMNGTVDVKSADWLVSGISSYIIGMGYGGLAKTDSQNPQIPDLLKLLARRFDNLNETTVHEWMSASNKLIEKAATYRSEYRDYLVQWLSHPDAIKLRFSSRSNGMYLGEYSLDAVASALANSNQNQDSNQSQVRAGFSTAYFLFDAKNKPIDSRLLTLTLIKTLDSYFQFQKTVDQFTFGNVISGLFDKEYFSKISQIHNFQQAKPDIQKMLSQITSSDGNSISISYEYLTPVLYGLLDIRLPIVYLRSNEIKNVDLDENTGFWVEFKNWKDGWELMSNNQIQAQEPI